MARQGAGPWSTGPGLGGGGVSGPQKTADSQTRRRLPTPPPLTPKARLRLRLRAVSSNAAGRRRKMRRVARFASALHEPHAKGQEPFARLRPATQYSPAGRSQSAQVAWGAHASDQDRRTPDAAKAWPTS